MEEEGWREGLETAKEAKPQAKRPTSFLPPQMERTGAGGKLTQ